MMVAKKIELKYLNKKNQKWELQETKTSKKTKSCCNVKMRMRGDEELAQHSTQIFEKPSFSVSHIFFLFAF